MNVQPAQRPPTPAPAVTPVGFNAEFKRLPLLIFMLLKQVVITLLYEQRVNHGFAILFPKCDKLPIEAQRAVEV